MLESILADLEKHLEIPAVKGKNESEGYYLLQINESMEVWVKDLNPGIFLQTIIAPIIRTSDQEDFFIYLMKANFLGQGTGGGVLSIDPEEKYIYLSLCLSYEVNYKTFRDKLEDFINYLDFWRKKLKNLEDQNK